MASTSKKSGENITELDSFVRIFMCICVVFFIRSTSAVTNLCILPKDKRINA